MNKLEKLAYLKGLVAGLNLNDDKKDTKVIKNLMELLEDIVLDMENLEDGFYEFQQQLDEIPAALMTCHHCIRYANGMCSKETGQKATPLYIRNGANAFRLEFDCRNCLMRVMAVAD